GARPNEEKTHPPSLPRRDLPTLRASPGLRLGLGRRLSPLGPSGVPARPTGFHGGERSMGERIEGNGHFPAGPILRMQGSRARGPGALLRNRRREQIPPSTHGGTPLALVGRSRSRPRLVVGIHDLAFHQEVLDFLQ